MSFFISQKKFFDEIKVGDRFQIDKTLTQDDVEKFKQLSGDVNPLHLDESFAKEHGFKAPVVYGMLLSSYISTIIGNVIPGEGALWSTQQSEFVAPAFIGDAIKVEAEVVAKSISTRVLTLKISITNQMNLLLVRGKAEVKVLESPKGKIVNNLNDLFLIIGGSKGIGAATALELASKGKRVVINYNQNEAMAYQLCQRIEENGGQAFAYKADMRNEAEVNRMVDEIENKWGIPYGVAYCAAPHPFPLPFQDSQWEEFDKQWQTQIKGAYSLAKKLTPKMIANQAGSWVFLGSIYGEGNPPSQQLAYVTVKSAINGFVKGLAQELGPKGIRVNCVAPGMTQTDMIQDIPDKVKMLAKMQTPLRKLATPSDVAQTVTFLLSEEASHITGETVRICGGIYM